MIDPLGGSYYVETLTDEMEARIEAVIAEIDAAGGMYAAVEKGLVQSMIGRSALAWQERIESGSERVVGVNCYREDNTAAAEPAPYRPEPGSMMAHVDALRTYKAGRSQAGTRRAVSILADAARSDDDNLFAAVVDAARAGVTHGEIVACLREELGFGEPLIAA